GAAKLIADRVFVEPVEPRMVASMSTEPEAGVAEPDRLGPGEQRLSRDASRLARPGVVASHPFADEEDGGREAEAVEHLGGGQDRPQAVVEADREGALQVRPPLGDP